MSDPLFWQLSFMVLQEVLVMTAICTAGYYLIRGALYGLESASRAAKARRVLALEPEHAPVMAKAAGPQPAAVA